MGASAAGCRCTRIRKSTALHRSSCRMRGDSSPAALRSRDHIGDVCISLQGAIRGSEPYVAFRRIVVTFSYYATADHSSHGPTLSGMYEVTSQVCVRCRLGMCGISLTWDCLRQHRHECRYTISGSPGGSRIRLRGADADASTSPYCPIGQPKPVHEAR